MDVYWTDHARKNFVLRAEKYCVAYGQFEIEIIKQKTKLWLRKDVFKSIFMINGRLFTAIKADKPEQINVITLLESNRKERILWNLR